MRAVKRFVWLLAVLLLLPCPAFAEADIPVVSAEGAILIEAGSGRVLYEKNADARLEEASTTKIMTAILAIEAGDLDRIVTIPAEAVGTEGSSLYLHVGETLPLRELLYGLMLQSGNDASVAIAIAVSGSIDTFVAQMNDKAAALHLTQTHFANPNGLPDPNHYTSARDLALLSAYAMQNETFRTIVSTQYRVTENSSVPRTIKNKNKFLWQYEGCNGLKTGYTKAAGKCLAFSAQRDGMQLIGVILNAPGMWDDARKLLDYGFDTFALRTVVSVEEEFTVQVQNGEKSPCLQRSKRIYCIRSERTEQNPMRPLSPCLIRFLRPYTPDSRSARCA